MPIPLITLKTSQTSSDLRKAWEKAAEARQILKDKGVDKRIELQ